MARTSRATHQLAVSSAASLLLHNYYTGMFVGAAVLNFFMKKKADVGFFLKIQELLLQDVFTFSELKNDMKNFFYHI